MNMNLLLVGEIIGSVSGGILGFVLGVVHAQRTPARRQQRALVKKQKRIEELAILDSKPGIAMNCPSCGEPVGKHCEHIGFRSCQLSREVAAEAAKAVIAGELSVLRYGPPPEVDSASLLAIRKNLEQR